MNHPMMDRLRMIARRIETKRRQSHSWGRVTLDSIEMDAVVWACEELEKRTGERDGEVRSDAKD